MAAVFSTTVSFSHTTLRLAFRQSASYTAKASVLPFCGASDPAAAAFERASLQKSFLGDKVICRARSISGSQRRSLSLKAMAAIKVGDKLPDASLSYFDKEGNIQSMSVKDLTDGKKVVLFAVPGAFTPTCSLKHLPGFIEKADELKAKGVDTVACVSVNDVFVMKAWGESVGTGDKVLLLADGSGLFTEKLGVALDLKDKGLGIRSRRYSMLVDNGVVKILNLEEGGAFTNSGAEDILSAL